MRDGPDQGAHGHVCLLIEQSAHFTRYGQCIVHLTSSERRLLLSNPAAGQRAVMTRMIHIRLIIEAVLEGHKIGHWEETDQTIGDAFKPVPSTQLHHSRRCIPLKKIVSRVYLPRVRRFGRRAGFVSWTTAVSLVLADDVAGRRQAGEDEVEWDWPWRTVGQRAPLGAFPLLWQEGTLQFISRQQLSVSLGLGTDGPSDRPSEMATI